MSRLFKSSSLNATANLEEGGYLSITDTNRLINDILESQIPQLLFRGEISEVKFPVSGHIYLTVKDEGSQLSCTMWKGVARALDFKPRVGMKVRCHAHPNMWVQAGRFQMIIDRMYEDGEGELQRKFIELQKRLEKEGFFAEERKRELPFLPKAVGIVTSRTGAVIHDMMVKIQERFPSMVVYLADTRVQGEGAAAEIASAIRRLDRSGLVDVIIVARGGGSLEDLWAFNEEEVVKAVFSCSRPVISGVGHEVDVTLCDLAADKRAPTPTAAAEMVVPHREDLLAYVAELSRRLNDTDRWLQPLGQRVDDLSLRLHRRLEAVGSEARLRLRAAEASLARLKPDQVLKLLSVRLNGFEQSLKVALRRIVDQRAGAVKLLEQRNLAAGGRLLTGYQARVQRIGERLEAVSPQAVLNRGFAVVYSGGKHVRSVLDVGVGDPIDVRVSDGIIKAECR